MSIPGRKVSNTLLGKSGGRLLIAPQRMERPKRKRRLAVAVSGGESQVQWL